MVTACSPVSAYWTLSFTKQKCINEEAHVLAAGIINTVTDFIIVLLPIKTVKNLNLPKKQRIAVYLLFTGGLLASIAGAVRTYFTWRLTSSPDHDITWNSYYVMLLSSIELFVGIVCCSVLAIPSFSYAKTDLVFSPDMRLDPSNETLLRPLHTPSCRLDDFWERRDRTSSSQEESERGVALFFPQWRHRVRGGRTTCGAGIQARPQQEAHPG